MENEAAGIEALTKRHKEILRLVYQHYQTKEIARALNISERTVKTHTEEIRRRLDVTTSRDAARLLAAHETALGRDDRWSAGPMADDEAGEIVLPHEQAALSKPVSHGDPLGSARNGLARDGDAAEAVLDPEHTGGHPGSAPDQWRGSGLVRPDRGNRLVDRRGDSLEQRLARLNAFQWLGLIVVVGVLSAILVSGLIAAVIGTLEGLQVLNRQIG